MTPVDYRTCPHLEVAASAHTQWCERCGVTLDPEDTAKVLAVRDASLGGAHVWTAARCPAYSSLNVNDCTC